MYISAEHAMHADRASCKTRMFSDFADHNDSNKTDCSRLSAKVVPKVV